MNTRLTLYVLTWLILICFVPATLAKPADKKPLKTIHFVQQDLDISVEIANTEAERETGLMNRASMPEKHGMLFVFQKLSRVSVWMKDTLMPLDVLFLDADGRIVSMFEHLSPCKKDPCEVYTFDQPGWYMLEINANLIKKYHLALGQQLRLPKLD